MTFVTNTLYFVDFSNTLHNEKIQRLAEADVNNVVNQVQEVYADFQTVNEDLFSLDVGSVLSLSLLQPAQWTVPDQLTANRIVDGLFGVLMATRTNPLIRFDSTSPLCKYLASQVQAKLESESDFVSRMSRNSEETLLLIIDRKQDPVTPLLNQWTYQAMVHELMGIQNNRVDLKHLDHLPQEMKEVVLSSDDDTFYQNVMYKNYGEVAEEIHNLVQKFLTNKKSQAQFKSIEDMQRVIENFPEFKKSQRNTTKHFNILEEVRRLIEARQLYKISEVEQDLAAASSDISK